MGASDADASLALGRVLGVIDDLLRLRNRVDLRRNDSTRPDIQHLLDPSLFVHWNPDQTRCPVSRRLNQGFDGKRIVRAMFGVNEQPVEPGVAQDLCGLGTVEADDRANSTSPAQARRRKPFSQPAGRSRQRLHALVGPNQQYIRAAPSE